MKQFYSFLIAILFMAGAREIQAQELIPKNSYVYTAIGSTSQKNVSIAFSNIFTYPDGVTSLSLTEENVSCEIDSAWLSYYKISGQNFAFTVAAGETGSTKVKMTVEYNSIITETTFHVNIVPVLGAADAFSGVVPGTTATFNVLNNDTFMNSKKNANLTITQQPNFGTIVLQDTVIYTNNYPVIKYTANADAANYTNDTLKYIAIDSLGNQSNEVTVPIEIYLTSTITKVFEFLPGPGQFVNTSIANSEAAKNNLVVGTMVSLGGWGGYVIVGFDQPIVNRPEHRYGVDFTVRGNAFGGWAEPAAVMVMKDVNGNGLPDDDQWYELAGSEYYFNSAIKNLTMTYYNPKYDGRYTIPFNTDKGVSGAMLTNGYHQQAYYPDPFDFGISPDSVSFTGTYSKFLLDKSRKGYVTAKKLPCFGYADNHPNAGTATKPQNPYYKDDYGTQTDGFDLSWAVDRDGNAVALDTVHFVKVYATVQEDGGWLGEVSPEIASITLTTPDASYIPQDYYVHVIGVGPLQVQKGKSYQYEGILFKNGKPDNEGTATWTSSNTAVGTVDNTGLFQAVDLGTTVLKFQQRDNAVIDSVTVEVVELQSVVLEIEGNSSASSDTVSVKVGETIYITAQAEDNRTAGSNRFVYETYNWTNTDTNIGIVTNGLFKANTEGKTYVYATSTSNPSLKDSILVIVEAVPDLVLTQDTIVLDELAAQQLKVGGRTDVLTTGELFTRVTGNTATIFLKDAQSTEDLATADIVLNKLEYAFGDGKTGVEKIQLEVEYYNQKLFYDLYLKSEKSTTAINNSDANDKSLKVYPNPFTEGFYVNLTNAGSAKLTIYGISGKLMMTKTVSNGEFLDVSVYPSGQYVIKIQAEDGSLLKEVIIKK